MLCLHASMTSLAILGASCSTTRTRDILGMSSSVRRTQEPSSSQSQSFLPFMALHLFQLYIRVAVLSLSFLLLSKCNRKVRLCRQACNNNFLWVSAHQHLNLRSTEYSWRIQHLTFFCISIWQLIVFSWMISWSRDSRVLSVTSTHHAARQHALEYGCASDWGADRGMSTYLMQ